MFRLCVFSVKPLFNFLNPIAHFDVPPCLYGNVNNIYFIIIFFLY